MTSSPIKARVPFPTFFDAVEAPLDTYYAQALANNALHQADQYAQVRVNYSPPVVTGSVRDSYLEPDTPLRAANEWQPIVVFGPFPVSMTASGAYDLRVRIAGELASAGVGKVAAVWSAPGEAAGDLALEGDNVIIMDLTSTVSAWKAGAPKVLLLDADQVAAARQPLSTPIDFGGDPSAVNAVMTTLAVYGQATSTSVTPRLTALYAAELAP